jgi:two-component system, LytTR family, sensor kinase
MKHFNRIIRHYKLHHVFFWATYIIVWMQVYKSFYENTLDLFLVTSVYAFSHGSMYYITQYVLIPQLLRKRKIILFILSLAITLAILITLMFLTIQWILGITLVGTFGPSLMSIIFLFGFSNLFMVALLLSIKMIMDNLRNQRIEERKEKERLETELQYLKSQVNPHFLFNTINSVYVLIKKDPEKASQTLIKLSDLLRAQLYDFGAKKIGIEQETEYLENYMDLEKMRKGEKLRFEYEKSNSVKGFSIAPLLLMPFLENCFKHVSSYSGHKNVIRVSLDHSNNEFSAMFFNTKEENQSLNGPGGIGLKNVIRRLELLYADKHKLFIHDRPDSFEVILTLETNDR